MADIAGAGRLPVRVLTLAGVSTATYALSLAAVTALQSAAEAAVMADREPVASLIDDVSARNDRLAGQLDGLTATDGLLATSYESTTAAIGELETSLGELASTVARVDGAARALPAAVALPPVVRSARSGGGSPATSHATSGGSAVR